MINFFNSLRLVNYIQPQTLRYYAFKSDLKIKWVRPAKIPCIKPEKSGDAAQLPPVKSDEFVTRFRESKELQTADDIVKSIFQLGTNRNLETSNFYRDMYLKEVQRHPLDYGSMEAKLATMTATVRCYQNHMEKCPKDIRIKVKLKELIEKRKKFLKYLRRWDYRRFEWILEKLDLIYKPPPNKFHPITRKESLVKLTNIYCENIKQERLDEYRKQLEEQQIPFLEKKAQTLEQIRKLQEDCQISTTGSLEEIKATKQKLEKLKKQREELALDNKE